MEADQQGRPLKRNKVYTNKQQKYTEKRLSRCAKISTFKLEEIVEVSKRNAITQLINTKGHRSFACYLIEERENC